MIDLLLDIKERIDDLEPEEKLSVKTKQVFYRRYDTIIETGYLANPPPEKNKKKGQPKQGRARNMLNRLSDHSHEVLTFMEDTFVPFDNNQAERDIRMVKVKQKISGVFRSGKGADIFCRIRGYISTARKTLSRLLPQLLMPSRATSLCQSFSFIFGFQRSGGW